MDLISRCITGGFDVCSVSKAFASLSAELIRQVQPCGLSFLSCSASCNVPFGMYSTTSNLLELLVVESVEKPRRFTSLEFRIRDRISISLSAGESAVVRLTAAMSLPPSNTALKTEP